MIHCRVSPTPQISVSKAPPPHPHTLDPFQEVKEYMLEAEDYAHFLNDKVNVSKILESLLGTLWQMFKLLSCMCTSQRFPTIFIKGNNLLMKLTFQRGDFF